MACSPPTKPPRGVKYVKETSGLLMSVIRSLSASETTEQRDREKAKLEKEYKHSDKRLDDLVLEHEQNLTQVMQLFAKLSADVTSSREKINLVKENLHACKQLLHCRRDKLRKLWLEGIEHKHVLQLLNEIEYIKKVPAQLSNYILKKQYLQASKLLVSAMKLCEGSLNNVEALREVRSDLKLRKETLNLKILDDLSHHIYHRYTPDILALQKQGSGHDIFSSPLQQFNQNRPFNDKSASKSKRNLMSSVLNTDVSFLKNIEHNFEEMTENQNIIDPELNPSYFLATIIESLALLDRLPEAIEVIKVQMQTELLDIISRTSQQILENLNLPLPHSENLQVTAKSAIVISDSNKASALSILLYALFEQIRFVANNHAVVIKFLNQALSRHKLSIKAYEMSDYWSKVQAVLQLLLTDYLDIQNISEPNPVGYFEHASDVSSFFTRRKIQSKKRSYLFKFDHSSNAPAESLEQHVTDSSDNFSLEGRKRFIQKKKRDKFLVCQPTPNNITIIFIPVIKFIEEIEQELDCKPGVQCTLNAFLADYMKEVFLGRYHLYISSEVDAATKSHDAWRSIIDTEKSKDTPLQQRPLLQSTVLVNTLIWETRNLMLNIPLYTDNFFSVICMVLKQYREICQSAYRGIVQPDTEDKRICSAAWLKDEDICRFLKTLPNWVDLKAQQFNDIKTNNVRRHGRQQESTEEESPEDVKQRNSREAEILISNLGEDGINAHEILSDVMVLKELAILQESLEWFSANMIHLANELQQQSMNANVSEPKHSVPSAPIVKERSLKCLLNLAQEFDELANTCLLVLHLEVRIQCFHYLLPRSDQYYKYYNSNVNDTHEPDTRVQDFAKLLVTIDDAMGLSLAPRKVKYIFEGLGHLVSKILINASQYMDRIDDVGIRKMFRNVFALQQTLSNITMTREVALDYAHQYYEMLYLEPEEILNDIIENGCQFTEIEYINAIQLVHRSRTGNKESSSVNTYLQRLSQILGNIGVTV